MDEIGNVIFDRATFFTLRNFAMQASFGFVDGFGNGIAFFRFLKTFGVFVHGHNDLIVPES